RNRETHRGARPERAGIPGCASSLPVCYFKSAFAPVGHHNEMLPAHSAASCRMRLASVPCTVVLSAMSLLRPDTRILTLASPAEAPGQRPLCTMPTPGWAMVEILTESG